MNKIKLTALHIKAPKISTTAVLIGAAILFVLSTFAYGAIRKQQLDKATEAAHAAQLVAQHDQKVASDKAYKETTAELTIQRNKATLACSQLVQYAAAPKTKALVVVPAYCK